MSIGHKGQNLIFVLSQPRVGSTMLQRILGGHPDVYTTSEPWLLLPSLRILSDRCHQDGFEFCWSRKNIQTFIELLPGGREEYNEAIRRMHVPLYTSILEKEGKRVFLDKTPRYAYAIPELVDIFPEATYLFLLRNPLAVLCSFAHTWVGNDFDLLDTHWDRSDLLMVPSLLIEGLDLLGSRGLVLQYERLVENPESEMSGLCQRLGIDFRREMIDYGGEKLPHWNMGDQFVYKHSRPAAEKARAWQKEIKHPVMWYLADRYLKHLGPDVMRRLGYDYAEQERIVNEARPATLDRLLHLELPRLQRRGRRFLPNSLVHKFSLLTSRLKKRGGTTGADSAAVVRKP